MNSSHSFIKNKKEERSIFLSRAIISLIFTALLFVFLIARMFNLQVTEFNIYKNKSYTNRVKLKPITAKRGSIYDRTGKIIANNKKTFSMEIIPENNKDIKRNLEIIKHKLMLDQQFIDNALKDIKKSKSFQRTIILKNLTPKQMALYSTIAHKVEGIYIKESIVRNYLYKQAFAHVVGYTGRINSSDVEKLKEKGILKQYEGTKNIGKQGIEKSYEKYLHGIPGKMLIEINNTGRKTKNIKKIDAVKGQDIFLTIDADLQNKAYEKIKDKKGAIVAMDPNTGEVLAMVSTPSYDPSLFSVGITTKDYQELNQSKHSPLLNRATKGQYAPASTVKPHLALAGLENKSIKTTKKIWDPGWWSIPDVKRRWRDWKKSGHGWVDLKHAISGSCDVFFYDLSYKLGISKISEFMKKLGFGKKTGIDIFEESEGTMPDKDWKKQKYNIPWYVGDTISVGIGQGYWTATPLQMAQSTAIIATKGKVTQPHIFLKTQTDNNETKKNYIKNKLKINNSKNWDIVSEGMYLAGHDVHGTAFKIFKDSPYKVAVKSGTSQLFNVAEDEEYESNKVSKHLRDHALFVGWAPYKNPKIVVAIVIENAGWGGSNAGPIAKTIFDEYLLDKTENENNKKQKTVQ